MLLKYRFIFSTLLCLPLCAVAQAPSYVYHTRNISGNLTARYYSENKALDKAVDSVYLLLNDRERAAQMIMTASSTYEKLGYPFVKAKRLVSEDIAANVVFLKGSAAAFRREVKELNDIKSSSVLPPLYACDCEPTLITSKWNDVDGVRPASQQKDETAVAENTRKINEAIKKVGVQLNFAPVVDIAANKSVINTRSFGSTPGTIITLSKQFVKISQDNGIGATLKHFPGHGAVKGDSHKQSVFIDGKLTELNTFKEIIQSETPPISVMIGHIVVKNNPDYSTNGLPATLSGNIVTKLLRKELGFKGIITTDALNMEAAAKIPDADWKAVIAGVDLVLMPKDARSLNENIVKALQGKNELSAQLETSIKRIIRYKLLM